MDPTVKQMLDGFRMGANAQAGMAVNQELVEEVRGIIAKMEAVAGEPGMDIIKFQERVNAEGLMNAYGEAMARLATTPIDCKPSEGIAQALETDGDIEVSGDVIAEAPLYELDNLPFIELKPEDLGINVPARG